MKLRSVNVAEPVEVTWRGRTYPTAIFKEPVAGRVRLGRENLAGDSQGNPRTHGGPEMAVHAYSFDHYAHWESEFENGPLAMGSFGENFTVEGLTESEIAIGDTFRIGGALVQVSEPRTPCHKLAMKFRDTDLPRRFLESGWVGWYLRVLEEGEVGAGDEIIYEQRDSARLTITDVLALWHDKGASADAVAAAARHPALSPNWRELFAKRAAAGAASAAAADLRQWDAERLAWT